MTTGAWRRCSAYAGQVRVLDGDLEGAAADFEEAQRRLQPLGATSDDLMAHMRLADLRLRAGDPAGARAHVEAMRRSRSPGELETMRDVLVEVTERPIARRRRTATRSARRAAVARGPDGDGFPEPLPGARHRRRVRRARRPRPRHGGR